MLCAPGKANTKLFLQTPSADVVEIDAATETASITMANGKVFPLQARPRELIDGARMTTTPLRRCAVGGHFNLFRAPVESQETAGDKKEKIRGRGLQFGGAFGGALLTSGSFTMMAASGGF